MIIAQGLPAVLEALSASYWVVGAALGDGFAPESIAADRHGGRPLALVMGNEEEGLSAETLAACTQIVTIPGVGHDRMQSLNVAASSAILIHALLRPTA